MNKKCPCGSGPEFLDCCGAIITGKRSAATCLELMKSRYTAFTMGEISYLKRSHHSKTRPSAKEFKQTAQWTKSVQWMGLSIVNTWNGEATQKEGHVEFKALYFEDGQMQQIHEKSLFQRENGKWVYVSGVHF